MKYYLSSEKIENEANSIGINIYPTFNWVTRSLLVSNSQKKSMDFLNANWTDNQLKVLQAKEDSVWKELMNINSHKVMQILLSIMNNQELWNWLVLIPWVNTICWNSTKDNWLYRSTPNAKNNAYHPLMSNLPLHTDSIMSEYHDDNNELVIARVLHWMKYKPTWYYYLGDLMPDMIDNRAQALQIAELIWYDAMKLFKSTISIKDQFERIMSDKNIPNLNFDRSQENSGFTIHSWIKYGKIEDIRNNNIKNPIAHVWYLPWKDEPTWYLRFISADDFDDIFKEYI